MGDLTHRSAWNHRGIMYGNYKDPGKRSGVELIFGPGGLEIAETNRRDVRDKLVGPLTAAMGN